MEKMEYTREFINLINNTFYLHEAADICMREFSRQMEVYFKGGLQHKLKQKFSNIMETVRRLEYLTESFLEEYNEFFGEDIGRKSENVRQIASYFARLALLIGDRCDNGDGTKEALIYQFVENMPEKNAITQKTLDKLTL